MGERAGYRVREGNTVSHILRKQWFIGNRRKDIETLVKKVARKLLINDLIKEGVEEINSGGIALRHDLYIGRLTASLFSVLYEPPFDSIEHSPDCDISDWGLYEIELVEWNRWVIWHYDVAWNDGELENKEKIAEVTFQSGKMLDDGMHFVWYGDKNE